MTDKTPPTTPPTNNKEEEQEEEEEVVKFEKSLTENLNNRFYSNNNNKNEDDEKEDEIKLNLNEFKNLKDFGYYYNDKGELRNIKDQSKFKFVDQKHYDKLGDIIVDEIQEMMKSEPYNLIEKWIPSNEKYQCNIFHSKEFFENKSKPLMVIVNGSGAVKSGQWARSLCINDSLNTGTILPYLKDAISNNFEILVLNPNYNKFDKVKQSKKQEEQQEESKEEKEENEEQPLKKMKNDNDNDNYDNEYIKGNENSNNHIIWMYDNFIKKSLAEEIVIVAHSFGGINTVTLLEKRGEELKDKLKSIGFTDSVHSVNSKTSKKLTLSILKERSKNWVRSDKPVNTDLGFSKPQNCNLASSGHTVHEFTSEFCRSDLFKFILKSLKK